MIWGGSGSKTLGPIGTGVRPPLRSLGMSDFSGCHGVLYFVYSLTWLAPYFVWYFGRTRFIVQWPELEPRRSSTRLLVVPAACQVKLLLLFLVLLLLRLHCQLVVTVGMNRSKPYRGLRMQWTTAGPEHKMSEQMQKDWQIECQNICQIKCQRKNVRKNVTIGCQKDRQKECQNMCRVECQKYMSNKMSDRMPERMSARMSENLCLLPAIYNSS